jgi:haloalkane dehalogenase
MLVLRTPDERFKNLPGFPFDPHYVDVNGLRVHYLDEGAGDQVILCLHGVLEWSYAYRKVIPLLAVRHRVIAMDFIGFGRSDKPANGAVHTLQMHSDIVAGFIDALGLNRITLAANDWGAVVGLKIATEHPELFNRLVVLNTALPTGDRPLSITFKLWQKFVEFAPDLPIGRSISMGLSHGYRMSPKEMAAYEAPFPDGSYKAGAVQLPLSLPGKMTDPVAEEMRRVRDRLAKWNKPALVMFSDEDPLFSREYAFFRELIPTAGDEPDSLIGGAGHFLHEERGQEIAQNILSFIERNPM